MCTENLRISFPFFFFQAEDGIRDATVTGVQTCALPILKYGFWNAQTYWYGQWSGRFFSTLLVTLFCRPSLMGGAYPVGPLAVVVLLLVGLFVLTRAAFPAGAGKRPAIGITLAVVAV